MEMKLDTRTARAAGVILAFIAVAGITACGDDEPSGPVGGGTTVVPGPRAGANQVAAPGQAFTDEIRVQVLVGGVPAGGIEVTWTPSDGTASPSKSISGANGVAATNWTLGGGNSLKGDGALAAETAKVVTMNATVATGAGVQIDGFSIPADYAAVEVSNNQFVPYRPAGATTVAAGTSVTWYWTSDAVNHNISPTGGTGEPVRSGEPRDGAYVYTQFFEVAGTYTYECETDHGGAKHTGTVTVTP